VNKFFKLFFYFLALKSISAYASPVIPRCSEILKSPFKRNKEALQKEIFEFGQNLLKEFFGHTDYGALTKDQRQAFVFKNKAKIIENVVKQGTELEPYKDSSVFIIKGGTSRLGRIAKGLVKMGINVVLDIPALLKMNASGYYSPERHVIILGLEDALFPNQLSYNFFHEAFHASLDYKALFIPRIYDDVGSRTYKDFSLDEVSVYSKQILQMVNENIKAQNKVSLAKNLNSEMVESMKVYKELSLRTLRKKSELLKVVEYLKKVEDDPSILKINEDKKTSFILEGLDPQVVLLKSGFYEYKSSEINDELLALDPSARLKVFKGDEEAYMKSLSNRAWASRLIIEEALYFAELAFR
jgi:hypothetical protein